MDWTKILALIGVVFLAWYSYRVIKHRPDLFTLANFNKSLRSLIILAFILIAFVWVLVFLLKAS